MQFFKHSQYFAKIVIKFWSWQRSQWSENFMICWQNIRIIFILINHEVYVRSNLFIVFLSGFSSSSNNNNISTSSIKKHRFCNINSSQIIRELWKQEENIVNAIVLTVCDRFVMSSLWILVFLYSFLLNSINYFSIPV